MGRRAKSATCVRYLSRYFPLYRPLVAIRIRNLRLNFPYFYVLVRKGKRRLRLIILRVFLRLLRREGFAAAESTPKDPRISVRVVPFRRARVRSVTLNVYRLNLNQREFTNRKELTQFRLLRALVKRSMFFRRQLRLNRSLLVLTTIMLRANRGIIRRLRFRFLTGELVTMVLARVNRALLRAALKRYSRRSVKGKERVDNCEYVRRLLKDLGRVERQRCATLTSSKRENMIVVNHRMYPRFRVPTCQVYTLVVINSKVNYLAMSLRRDLWSLNVRLLSLHPRMASFNMYRNVRDQRHLVILANFRPQAAILRAGLWHANLAHTQCVWECKGLHSIMFTVSAMRSFKDCNRHSLGILALDLRLRRIQDLNVTRKRHMRKRINHVLACGHAFRLWHLHFTDHGRRPARYRQRCVFGPRLTRRGGSVRCFFLCVVFANL